MTERDIAAQSTTKARDAAYDAWDQARDQFMKPFDDVCKAGFKLGEKIEDQTVAIESALPFVGEWLAEQHCQNLHNKAEESMEDGRPLAAEHYLKRELAFAGWTLGYDHEITNRLIKEITTPRDMTSSDSKVPFIKINDCTPPGWVPPGYAPPTHHPYGNPIPHLEPRPLVKPRFEFGLPKN